MDIFGVPGMGFLLIVRDFHQSTSDVEISIMRLQPEKWEQREEIRNTGTNRATGIAYGVEHPRGLSRSKNNY